MNEEQTGSGGSAGGALVAAGNLTPSRVDDWIGAAQPGARLSYFHGWSFARDGDQRLGEHLRRQEARGLIYLVQGRKNIDGERDYIAQRSSRPAAEDQAVRRRPLTIHEQAREFAARGGR